MKITFISDTHGLHNKLTNDLPGGWMIIHCGDVSNVGRIDEINLNAGNAIVIGSGILEVLGIRDSGDIDIVVSNDIFENISANNKFKKTKSYGDTVLTYNNLEVRKSWNVLGKQRNLKDLIQNSVVYDGVRYISLEFLLRVKKQWVAEANSRKKDLKDIKLIESYLSTKKLI